MSLGQGQEVVAERALEVAAAQGHWVILQVGGGHWGGTPRSTACQLPAMARGVPRLSSLSVPIDTKVVSGMAEARGWQQLLCFPILVCLP